LKAAASWQSRGSSGSSQNLLDSSAKAADSTLGAAASWQAKPLKKADEPRKPGDTTKSADAAPKYALPTKKQGSSEKLVASNSKDTSAGKPLFVADDGDE
jgi:hypothetical protein